MHLEEHVSLVKFDPAGSIELHLLPGAPKELANELREKLNAWTGKRWMVALSKTPGEPPLGAGGARAQGGRDPRGAGASRRGCRSASSFPMREITSVRPLPPGEDGRYRHRMTAHLAGAAMKDLMKLMKQAGEIQGRMQKLQEDLAALEVEGQSGGGLVKVTLNGKMEARGIKIDPSLIKPDEAEMLEDLILAAFQDAKGKAEAAVQAKMQEITGGLQLPPGLKLF